MTHSEFLKLKEAWQNTTSTETEVESELHCYRYEMHPKKKWKCIDNGCYTTQGKNRPDIILFD